MPIRQQLRFIILWPNRFIRPRLVSTDSSLSENSSAGIKAGSDNPVTWVAMGPRQKFLELPFVRLFRGRRRGRLVRHYFATSLVLIGGGLIVSGLVELYFSYHDTRDHIALLQQEMATGAAFRIEQFILGIERGMRATAKSRDMAVEGLSPKYKFELERLLLISPSITELTAIDTDGFDRVQVARFKRTFPKKNQEQTMHHRSSPAFQTALQGRTYFGPVYFVRGSEPYIGLAVSIEQLPRNVIGVLRAEVDLRYVGEVISAVKAGNSGYAYVVTRSGELIAHPDISLVLQRTRVADLDQVNPLSNRRKVRAGLNRWLPLIYRDKKSLAPLLRFLA